MMRSSPYLVGWEPSTELIQYEARQLGEEERDPGWIGTSDRWSGPLHDPLYPQITEYHSIASGECAHRNGQLAKKYLP